MILSPGGLEFTAEEAKQFAQHLAEMRRNSSVEEWCGLLRILLGELQQTVAVLHNVLFGLRQRLHLEEDERHAIMGAELQSVLLMMLLQGANGNDPWVEVLAALGAKLEVLTQARGGALTH